MIAPMDWGLGHATRCIPLISAFLNHNCEVIIGGSGPSLSLIRREFPTLSYFELTPYAPVYSASSSLVMKLAEQLPKFFITIYREHRQTESIVKQQGVDIIVSDNRYGCWSSNAVSVFLTHQLNIILPAQVAWLKPVIDYFNASQISKFSHCWIPDVPGHDNLSGILSENKNIKTQHIGWLSRFNAPTGHVSRKYDVLIVLSGPEPQRSILEDKILTQLEGTQLRCLLVRGKVGESQHQNVDAIRVVDSLPTGELHRVIEESNVIVSRAGYSTIMDLVRMKKKAILIPTPGQTEQEYLALRMKEKGWAFCADQQTMNLQTALEETKNFMGFDDFREDSDLLEKAIESIVNV